MHLLQDGVRKGVSTVLISGGGTKKARYALTDKEIEHLVEERKKHGKRFIVNYNKDWDVKDVCEYEDEVEIEAPVEEDIPTRRRFDLDNVTTTISYMQDIKDRLDYLGKEKASLMEKLNDLDAEWNQLTNEYTQLKEEVISVI